MYLDPIAINLLCFILYILTFYALDPTDTNLFCVWADPIASNLLCVRILRY